jgi:single-strand DNA-binding protein
MELQGKLFKKFERQAISEKFSKREFILEVENKKNPQFNDKIKIELTQDNCDLIDNVKVGESIKVFINIKGREFTNAKKEISYFNTIVAWKIEKEAGKKSQSSETMRNSIADSTDLPF